MLLSPGGSAHTHSYKPTRRESADVMGEKVEGDSGPQRDSDDVTPPLVSLFSDSNFLCANLVRSESKIPFSHSVHVLPAREHDVLSLSLSFSLDISRIKIVPGRQQLR